MFGNVPDFKNESFRVALHKINGSLLHMFRFLRSLYSVGVCIAVLLTSDLRAEPREQRLEILEVST